MKITNMLPVLLDLFSGRSGQSKMNKPAPGKETVLFGRQELLKTYESYAAGPVRSVARKDVQAAGQPQQTLHLPDYLPLPLKSPLFDESAFYIKNEGETRAGRGNPSHTAIYIRLRTENLGTIWISLTTINESLSLSFFTEAESYTEALQETFPALVEGLQKMGYPSVKTSGITRPGIESCADIASGQHDSASYILNLEV